ncbi:MAG: response regulator [Bacteroidetes bacterium]|nr:response regulator [Bacteroidota bacterium]
MKIKNFKIGTQLKIGFTIMIFFVIVLGIISFLQTDKIQEQTETLYNHPLQVRRAIDAFRSDIFTIQRDMNDLFLTVDEKENAYDFNQIEISKANAFEQIDILYSRYLGQKIEIDYLKETFIIWNSKCEETIRLFRNGKITEAKDRTKNAGIVGQNTNILLSKLNKIDFFAKSKGDELYKASVELQNTLNNQLIIIIVIILVLTIIIYIYLLKSFKKPIVELTNATNKYHNGDMNARSSYVSNNEFGVLSNSFNAMIEYIQMNTDIANKVRNLASVMLNEYESRRFFQLTLNSLTMLTEAQMAAVYLLSNDRKTFDHYESLGIDDNARQSFTATNYEGEFGAAISTREIQHIKNIPQETRFVFHTVSGKYIPREIITLPILAGNKVIAIISLASISSFTKQTLQLIDEMKDTLNARIEGILAYRKMKEFSERLKQQNVELETQRTELSTQSAELIEQNTELEMQKKQLNEANRLKTNFLSNMSHELRTPLNSVIALSGVLNRRLAKLIPEEEYSYIEVIERNGKHLLDLINDILDISRIEAGREEIEINKFNINTLIAEIVTMIKQQAQQKNIDLLHTDADSELFFTSDDRKCRHILQNIISNAVKFTEKGKVEIFAKQNDNKLIIKISDTGIGIDENHIHHIFDEFRQADGSTSRKFGGTGLGLAIAKKYANLLGGIVSVKSILGQGSEFTLVLPLQYAPENRIYDVEAATTFNYAIKPTLQNPKPISSFKTILLVEDSEPAIIQIKDFIEENGYQILLARNGNEALQIVTQNIPDAIILDLMMPDIDGFEVLRVLRENEPTALIPVLILTAKHITKEDLKFLKQNNVHQLIQKGDVNRNELLNAITTMVSPEIIEIEKPKRKLQSIEGKPLVLVVEDNPDNMITVKALLNDKYHVVEAVNGNEGILMAKDHNPHLILMDIALPEKDGIEAFKAIRNDIRLQNIPIIALTASAMTSDRETILAHGFNAYIAKPIDEKIFFETINEVLYGK